MTGLPAEVPVGRRRTAPQPLADDRPPDARQPGETHAAYRAFVAYLEHGTIRAAAADLGRNRSTLERYSKRWRWPERVRLILKTHVPRWLNLAEYEEAHDLGPAVDMDALLEREMDVFTEVTMPRMAAETDQRLTEMLSEPVPEPEPFDPEEDMRLVMDRILSRE